MGALGMASGDGSLAPVVAAALERELPFVCIPFGTRNHFGLDLGLDADDPIGALSAFDGVERRVDIGRVGERWFVNNVSLGLYASFVHDPAKRTRNRAAALARMLPDALGRGRTPLDLYVEVDGKGQHHSALVALVANNAYELRSMADLGERKRLDEGRLHAYVIEAVSRRGERVVGGALPARGGVWPPARGRRRRGGRAACPRRVRAQATRSRGPGSAAVGVTGT
jgi:diacylglycerol kinase family enzyme